MAELSGASPPAPLAAVASTMTKAGVPYLPTGYSDARFLGNVVLAIAERDLSFPFARWVDDYRLFVASKREANHAFDQLDAGLARVGLRRNVGKTQVVTARTGIERHHRTLASVYHPEREATATVARKLREVFATAVIDPVEHRREIRFCLPRLAEQKDEIAIPFAVDVLTRYPWEAPRAVAYLAAFVDRGENDLASLIAAPLEHALRNGDAWIVSRVAALAARLALRPTTLQTMEARHEAFAGTPAWGLILRVLALHGRTDPVRKAIENSADARATLVASRDLGLRVPKRLMRQEPLLVEALETEPAPIPPAQTLL
jgi:hypothetical protein